MEHIDIINNEILLIRIQLTKAGYDAYSSVIDPIHWKENYRELWHIFQVLSKLHAQNPERDLTPDELVAAFWIDYPDAPKDIYSELLKTLSEAQIDPGVGDGIAKAAKQRQKGLELSQKAFSYTQGRSTLEELQSLIEDLQSGDLEPKEKFEGEDTDLEKILATAYKDGGFRWRLDFLNKSLGPLREGDFGFLFKRPESGGTAFLASEVSNFLDQTDRPIVWVNNEEANDKVMLRVYQAYFGLEVGQLLGNMEQYREEWKERVGRKFLFYGIDRSNRKDIESIVQRHKPAIVVVDQLDKVSGFDADREDLKLGSIYQWFRELSKKGFAAIGITQADGTAEGVKWLTMANVSSAKTSKQAEADFILGMGRTNDPMQEYVRYLQICKNKLLGDTNTIPSLRHGRAEILIQPEVMRFKDIIDYD